MGRCRVLSMSVLTGLLIGAAVPIAIGALLITGIVLWHLRPLGWALLIIASVLLLRAL